MGFMRLTYAADGLFNIIKATNDVSLCPNKPMCKISDRLRLISKVYKTFILSLG